MRPVDLWMQVQKTDKYVDFTKVGAEFGVIDGLWLFRYRVRACNTSGRGV
jgi:hypothetical protein